MSTKITQHMINHVKKVDGNTNEALAKFLSVNTGRQVSESTVRRIRRANYSLNRYRELCVAESTRVRDDEKVRTRIDAVPFLFATIALLSLIVAGLILTYTK